IAKRRRELASWRRPRWTRALRRRSRDGPLLRFRGQPLAFTRQQIEFAGKRNSGFRTEATAVALKLLSTSSRAVAAEITSGPISAQRKCTSHFRVLETITMETTQTMIAIRSHHRGGSETLVYEPVARPVPDGGEVLVE